MNKILPNLVILGDRTKMPKKKLMQFLSLSSTSFKQKLIEFSSKVSDSRAIADLKSKRKLVLKKWNQSNEIPWDDADKAIRFSWVAGCQGELQNQININI